MTAPHHRRFFSVLITTIGVSFAGMTHSSAEDDPTGTLNISSATVRENTRPTLTWDITHPTSDDVEEIIDIDPEGPITPKKDLYMDIRVLGAAVGSYTRYHNSINWIFQEWLRVRGYVAADGANYYSTFFDGKQTDVDPTEIVYSQLIREDRPNYFYSKYRQTSGSWTSGYSTYNNNDDNIIILKNGESMPFSEYDNSPQASVSTFLAPYLDSSGVVTIGSRDVIVLFELTQDYPGTFGFDMQDLVLLVTFREL